VDTSAALPAGPGSAFVAAVRYLRDPFAALLDAAARHADPFTWPTFLGPVVVTGDPAGIRDILTAPPDIYTALGAELLGPVLGTNNVILLSGDTHRAMRRFHGPLFQGDRLQGYADAITRITSAHAARWPFDRPFDIEDSLRAISLEVILEIVMGLDDGARREAFSQALARLIRALRPSFMFIPALRRSLLGLSGWDRFQRRAAQLAALIQREMEARRATSSTGTDVLSLLMTARQSDGTAMRAEQVMEQMVSLIGAGHDTTASALTWALFHIHRNPAVKDRLLAELRGVAEPAAIARLPYLDAVCAETLRLCPIAPLIGRTLRSPLSVKGHLVPAGASVGISIIGLHHRADLYPEPEKYVPDRFLHRQAGEAFTYLPFGGGARRCLGAAFALQELKLVLAAVLREHTLELVDPAPVRAALRNTTASPAKKIRMVRRRG